MHQKHHKISDISFTLLKRKYFKYSVLGILYRSGSTTRQFHAIPITTVPTLKLDKFT